MPMKRPDARVNRLLIAIDGEQQMAGQPLFRAHKLRLMPQIPCLHRGGIRPRRRLAIPAKAVSSRAWCRTIAARPAGVNPPSSSQAPSEAARPSRSAAGIASAAIWRQRLLHRWPDAARPPRRPPGPPRRWPPVRSSSGSAPAAAGKSLPWLHYSSSSARGQRGHRNLEPATAEVDDIAVAALAPVGGLNTPLLTDVDHHSRPATSAPSGR